MFGMINATKKRILSINEIFHYFSAKETGIFLVSDYILLFLIQCQFQIDTLPITDGKVRMEKFEKNHTL